MARAVRPRPLPEVGGRPTGAGAGADAARLLDDHGVVLLRNWVDTRPLRAAAAAIAEVLVEAGCAVEGPAVEGPAVGGATTLRPGPDAWGTLTASAELRQVFRRICCVEELHGLAHQSSLLGLVGRLLGTDDVLVHPRPVCRVVAPVGHALDGPTPAHQDHANMQGSPRALVAWMALVDCPLEAGPLQVADASHRRGPRPHSFRAGSGVATCPVEDLDADWLASDLGVGDVVVFDANSVHAALENRSGRFRLSVDVRYQPTAEPVCQLSLGGYGDLSWDEIYAAWDRRGAPAVGGPAPRHYWRDLDLSVVAYDSSSWAARTEA